jgi:hypothetical protein
MLGNNHPFFKKGQGGVNKHMINLLKKPALGKGDLKTSVYGSLDGRANIGNLRQVGLCGSSWQII